MTIMMKKRKITQLEPSCRLAFLKPGSALQAAGGETPSMSYPAVNPEGYNTNLPGRMCPSVQQRHDHPTWRAGRKFPAQVQLNFLCPASMVVFSNRSLSSSCALPASWTLRYSHQTHRSKSVKQGS